jgi:serine/threonine-protein kinase
MLVKGGTDGRYVPTGHLVYVRQGNLFAVPFDPERLELRGSPVPILEGVMQSTEGVAQFSFSALGSLAYLLGGVGGTDRVLVWVDRSGREQPLGTPPQPYASPRLSPDGERIAMTIVGANDEIWIYDIPNRRFNRLTFTGRNLNPTWTPDGKRITFRSDQGGASLNLFWMPADGSGAAERLAASEYFQLPWAWSPDGKSLVFSMLSITVDELWVLPLDRGRKPYPLLQTQFNDDLATFSPDGHWIAYASDESGQLEIYVRPFPNSAGVWQVSTDGGTDPVWARSGELFYHNGDKMMAVEVKTAPTFKAGVPKLLFEERFAPGIIQPYDVTPDGKRFLIVKSAEQEQASTQINVVLNWFEELKRRVPSGKK